MDLASIFSRQLIFVTGKGGTGKTTLAILLARLAAQNGQKVLLCHVNRLAPPSWEKEFVENEPTLTQISIDPESMFKEYFLLKFKSEKLFQLIFERFTAVNIMRKAAPALNELLLLGKIYWECNQKILWLQRKWDHVVVDLPATGHALSLLNIPSVVAGIFPRGIVSREVHRMRTLITDHQRACLIPVTLPEFIPVRETIDLIKVVENDLNITIGPIIVNRFPKEPESLKKNQKTQTNYSLEIDELIHFYQQKSILANRYTNFLIENIRKPVCTLPFIAGGSQNETFGITLLKKLLQYKK